MTEKSQYQHVEDFLTDYANSAELTGWIAYEQMSEERQANQFAYAVAKAFSGGKPATKGRVVDEDGEEVIDTTKPEFAEQFKGFTGTPGRRH